MDSGFNLIRRWVGAVAITGGLLFFGTGLHPLWPLTWFALLPLLVYAARAGWSAAGVAAVVANLLGSLNLWSYLHAAIGLPLMVCLVVMTLPAALLAVGVLLWRGYARRGSFFKAALLFAAAAVVGEFLNARLGPHSTFGSAAYTQMNALPVIQLASATGEAGITFLLFFVPAALAAAFTPGADRHSSTRLAALTAFVLAGVMLFGVVRLRSPMPTGPSLRIGLIDTDERANLFPRDSAVALGFLTRYAAETEKLARAGAQIIVLPEKIAQVDEADMVRVEALFRPIATRNGAEIVVGLARVDGSTAWNEALLFDPDGKILRYEKHHMIPGFEAQYTPGVDCVTSTYLTALCGLEICKDLDFPELSQKYGKLSAALLLVPAWDFVVDGWLHDRMAVMRGVEDGFAVARAAKLGRLTLSDSRGRLVAEATTASDRFVSAVGRMEIAPAPTLYSRWGDWFSWTCVVVALWLGRGLLPRRHWPRA